MSWCGGGEISPTPGVEYRVFAIHGYTFVPGSWPPSPGFAPCAILIWMSSALTRYSLVTPNRPLATCFTAERRSGSYRRSASALAKACPAGVNLYFDNTGGAISDIVLRHLAVGARVVICGTASVSSWNPWPSGPRAERHLLVKRARMQGFVIFDYAPRFEEAVGRLALWVRDGRLRYSEDVLEGIEHAPGAIAGLYRGENTGKRLIKIR